MGNGAVGHDGEQMSHTDLLDQPAQTVAREKDTKKKTESASKLDSSDEYDQNTVRSHVVKAVPAASSSTVATNSTTTAPSKDTEKGGKRKESRQGAGDSKADGEDEPRHEQRENKDTAEDEQDEDNRSKRSKAVKKDHKKSSSGNSVAQSVSNQSKARASNVNHNNNKKAPPIEDKANSDVSPSDVSGSLSEEEEDLEPVEVLLQFIPYYGQGDPANDSIVRSTLSSLSVEDIDSKDEYGNTLLLLACQYRCEDLVRIMLNKGADPNAVNSSGACGLHFACYRDSSSYNIAKILLTNGANPDIAETTYGCTPLHYCAGNGDLNFLKLLLSYGAQLLCYDYYNYTCVDYAREAGYSEITDYLQTRLDKVLAQQQQQQRNIHTAASPSNNNNTTNTGMSVRAGVTSAKQSGNGSSYDDVSQWESHLDPQSQSKYYIHLTSGECLWESELKQRMLQAQNNEKSSKGPPPGPPPSTKGVASDSNNKNNNNYSSVKIDKENKEKEREYSQQLLYMQQAVKARLIAFLTQYDPVRLPEVDGLLAEYNQENKLHELLQSLMKQYSNIDASIVTEMQSFVSQYTSLVENIATLNNAANRAGAQSLNKNNLNNNNASSNAIASIDPLALQEILQEARKKLELSFEEEKLQLKRRHEQTLEEEKAALRTVISEKDGQLSRLQSTIEGLQRDKQSYEQQVTTLQEKTAVLSSQGGAVTQSLEKELSALQEENRGLKSDLARSSQECHFTQEKLHSLELSLANLNSSSEEMLTRERAAASERAEALRLREMEHSKQLQDYEAKAKNAVLKLKSDLNTAKTEWQRQERVLREEYEKYQAEKEAEISALRAELGEVKAQAASELSSALLKVEDYKRLVEETEKRAQESESYMRSVQNELAEAKIVQKYNLQLHKDLQREQLARKKLHNEMEDMKGKIRVYVRIRPFSTTEKERGCSEAVLKDGKMSVIVKGAGGEGNKKIYDFDQVFQGVGDQSGNTQSDVFKDTKHLMMSVIDGYNVCIFAYGQTGAGKSYTMIGAGDIGTCLSEQGDFDDQAGITPRAVAELFRLLNERTAQVEYSVEVQMFQLYRDSLEDLLRDTIKKSGGKAKGKDEDENKEPSLKITLAEHSPTGLVHVEGAESLVATTATEVMKIFAKGSSRRTTASTQMNAESSRSHLICALVVKLTNRRTNTKSIGKLTLVDLAGSERVDKSGAMGEVLKEAQSINKSLSALGDVIAALTSGQQHVPYRNHPLTMLMSDSIGGNAKTLMFVNTSPADYNAAESNSSLAFASRCKDITNMVSAGPGVQAAQVNALKKELAKLKKGGGGAGGAGGGKAVMMMNNLTRPDTAAQSGRG